MGITENSSSTMKNEIMSHAVKLVRHLTFVPDLLRRLKVKTGSPQCKHDTDTPASQEVCVSNLPARLQHIITLYEEVY